MTVGKEKFSKREKHILKKRKSNTKPLSLHYIDKTDWQNTIHRKFDNIIFQNSYTKRLGWMKKPWIHYLKTVQNGIYSPMQILNAWKKCLSELDIWKQCTKWNKIHVLTWLTICDSFCIYSRLIIETILLLTFIICFAYTSIFFLNYLSRTIAIWLITISMGISKDAWLGFIGNVMGAIITILGVIVTIKSERKRDRSQVVQKSRPIVVLSSCHSENGHKNMYDGMININYESFGAKAHSVILISDNEIIAENIGFNFALNLSIEIRSLHICSAGYGNSGGGYLDRKEKKIYSFDVSFSPSNLDSFDRVAIKEGINEADCTTSIISHADIIRMSLIHNLHEDQVELVASDPITVEVSFQDVYGTAYKQIHNGRLFITRACDSYYAWINIQNCAADSKSY